MNRKKTSISPEQAHWIKQRYQDTSVVIFKEQQKAAQRYLSKSAWQTEQDEDLPETSYRYSRFGNEAIMVHEKDNVVTKRDTQAVQSVLCIVM